MGHVTEEIANVIKALKLVDSDIRLLDKIEGRKTFDGLLTHFVKSGDRRWWWEDFRQESFSFSKHEWPFQLLNGIIPETKDKVWLMIEDDQEDFYPIFEVRAEIIRQLIGETDAEFEYYIIDKNKEWLLCENHHSRLIGIGDKLRTKNLERIENG